MHKIELDINVSYSMKLVSFDPRKQFTKKKLTGNDWLTLFGALAVIASENEMSITRAVESASISCEELYLNDFEGYQISSRLNLRTLYLTIDDTVIASVYDSKKDRYIDFIAW